MSLSDLASLGSFVSGVAVLASLVFLFFQMRQMTEQVRQSEKNQRALINESVITRVSDLIAMLGRKDFAELWARQIDGDTKFTAAEIVQMMWSQRMRLTSLQDVMLQHRNGFIDDITFENSVRAVRSMLAQPVEKALWARSKDRYAPELAQFVDRLSIEAGMAERVDLAAQLGDDLAHLGRTV